jgi:hypothetical protein
MMTPAVLERANLSAGAYAATTRPQQRKEQGEHERSRPQDKDDNDRACVKGISQRSRSGGWVGRIPATVDPDRALDQPPLVLGRIGRVHGIPRRRGRLVEPPQRVGDRRPVQLQRGDRGRELGPDLGRHQVGQVARLGHEITFERTAQPTRAFRPS